MLHELICIILIYNLNVTIYNTTMTIKVEGFEYQVVQCYPIQAPYMLHPKA